MKLHTIIGIRLLTETSYIVRFTKEGLTFRAGQHICVGLPGDDDRPYSIYSAENDDYLEILVKEVVEGNISKKLKQLIPGTQITVNRPHGHFLSTEKIDIIKPLVFVATGTGIAPFHSYIFSNPTCTNFLLVHGIRKIEEAYESSIYDANKRIICTSKDTLGNFHGRVTHYFTETSINTDSMYFLCGNSEMIDELYEILLSKGVDKKNIKTEIYF